MSVTSKLSVLAIAAVVATVAAFLAVRALTGESPPQTLEEEYPQIAEARKKPRFEGELLGIYLGTNEALAAKGYIEDAKQACPGGFDVVEEHQAIPQAPPYLPEGAFQPYLYPAALGDQPNPAAAVCKDTGLPLLAYRYYELPRIANWLVPSISVGRKYNKTPYRMVDAPADHVKVVTLAGRAVIVVQPVVPEGGTVVSQGQVIIPEPSGYLYVQSDVLPFEETMYVAESLLGGGPTPNAGAGGRPTPSVVATPVPEGVIPVVPSQTPEQ